MTTYWKCVRPNGRDFYSDSVQWAPENSKARKGRLVKHPTSTALIEGDWSTGLAASTDPTRYPGAGAWPVRILEVEPVGEVYLIGQKVQALAWRVQAEVNPSIRFGPQGAHVVALIERAGRLTLDEVTRLVAARNEAQYAAWDAAQYAAWDAARLAAWDTAQYAARDAARLAAWDTARDAAWDTARDAAWDTARDAAWDAARLVAVALVVRDLIGTHGFTQEHYDTLTGPWRKVIGPLHPDDPDIREVAA